MGMAGEKWGNSKIIGGNGRENGGETKKLGGAFRKLGEVVRKTGRTLGDLEGGIRKMGEWFGNWGEGSEIWGWSLENRGAKVFFRGTGARGTGRRQITVSH